jgi:hypothetical protein
MTDISVRKHCRTTSIWCKEVGGALSGKPGGVGVVCTSDREGPMNRMASIKEGGNVACWPAEKDSVVNCKSYYGLFGPSLGH